MRHLLTGAAALAIVAAAPAPLTFDLAETMSLTSDFAAVPSLSEGKVLAVANLIRGTLLIVRFDCAMHRLTITRRALLTVEADGHTVEVGPPTRESPDDGGRVDDYLWGPASELLACGAQGDET